MSVGPSHNRYIILPYYRECVYTDERAAAQRKRARAPTNHRGKQNKSLKESAVLRKSGILSGEKHIAVMYCLAVHSAVGKWVADNSGRRQSYSRVLRA